MRLGCMALAGAIACFVFAYKGLSDNIKFRQPTVMTVAEFQKKKPQEGWFRITDATMILIEAKYSVYKSKNDTSTDSDVNRATQFFLPVHDAHTIDEKTSLLLETNDDSVKDVLLEADQYGANEKTAREWFEKNKSRIVVQRPIQGMVAAGLDASGSDHDELAKIGEELGPDFVILKEGNEPPPAYKSIGLIVLGVVLLPISLLFFGVGRRR